jgi:uncharacterized protein YyaL (SSP411 family)
MLAGGESPTPMPAVNGKATAYVCENYACKLPVTDPLAFEGSLEKLFTRE